MGYRPWTMYHLDYGQKKPIPKIRNGGVFKHEKKIFNLWAGKPGTIQTDL